MNPLNAVERHNNEAKLRALDALFAKYGEVWIIALSQAPGVQLPEHVVARHSNRIAIQLSDVLVRPTRHAAEADGIEFDVSFSGVYSTCWFPWPAVLVLHGPKQADGSAEMFGWSPPTQQQPPAPVERTRPALRVIKGGAA